MSRKDGRTEKPTPRRKREARRRGQQARSQEVPVAFSLFASALALRLLAPGAFDVVISRSTEIFSRAGVGLGGTQVLDSIVAMLAGALLPFLAVAVVAAVSAGVSQVGFTVAPKAAKPKLENLSPRKGLRRFKPSVMGWELLTSSIKLGLLAVIVWEPLFTWVRRLASPMPLGESLRLTGGQVWGLLMRAVLLAVLVAGADYAVNRRRTNAELRMTKHEVKEELRHQEGDPMVRARRRRRHLELSRNRMIRDVAAADVVVTNPTRLAVALVYGVADPAPRVVAKGAGKVADRIKSEARRAGVTVVEEKPLARALFRTVPVGQHVPSALFEAVAVVLAVAYRRRRRTVMA